MSNIIQLRLKRQRIVQMERGKEVRVRLLKVKKRIIEQLILKVRCYYK